MRLRLLPLIVIIFVAAAAAAADRIVLKSGKSLTGRITDETEDSYTIRVAPTMVLRISKDDVAEVERAKRPAAPRRPVVRLEPEPRSTAPASEPAATLPPAAKPSPTPAPPVQNPREFVNAEVVKVGVADLVETTAFVTYPVTGHDFGAVKSAITNSSTGLGFKNGRRRRPSKTEFEVSWSGDPGEDGKWKRLVVASTTTVTLPAWTTKGPVSTKDAARWASYVKEAADHEAGNLAIIHDAMVSFGQAATNLVEGSESDLKTDTEALFAELKNEVAKRREGFERRTRRSPLTIKPKKTPSAQP